MPDLDEDILRQLMFRSTDDLFAPPAAAGEAIRRQRRLRMRKRVLSAAGTAAAAGLAAGALASASGSGGPRFEQNGATGSEPAIRLTAAQQALFSLSAAAAKTPRPHGRYVVLTEQSISTGSGGGTKSSESGGKTSVIDTITGGGVTYQHITVSGSPGTPTPPGVLKAAPGTSPTVAQLDAMPTNPAKLRDVLLAQAREQIRQGEQAMEQQLKKLGKQGKKKAFAIAHQPTEPANDLIFEQATDLLWEPDLSPALRSAVYKVLAATPGVSVQTGAADSSGRPATEISRVNTVAHDDAETFLNPATGATLESAWAYPSGEFDADLYQKINYTNTFPSDPYNG